MILRKACKDYFIRSYECDKHGNLRLVTMMNIFQDISDRHAMEMGIGMEFCQSRGLAWIGADYHILISRFPRLHQKIIVRSWPAVEKKLGAYRDYIIEDENGETLVQASCQWILIDYKRKRPVALHNNLPEYQTINERAIETDFPKIEDINRIDYQTEFRIRFDDIDFNNHVNNAIYPLWASEALPQGFRDSHYPHEIKISFKKEAFLGEDIHVESEIDNMQTLHKITSLKDNRELARVKFCWM